MCTSTENNVRNLVYYSEIIYFTGKRRNRNELKTTDNEIKNIVLHGLMPLKESAMFSSLGLSKLE